MNVVNKYGEKRTGFAKVVAFCHVTCRYFDRFLLQGVDKNWRQACLFYLAPGLICEGYWQVNSRRSIFRIADPTIVLARYIGQCWQVHAFYLVSLLFIVMLASVSFPSCFVTFYSSGRSLLPFLNHDF